MRAPLSIYTYIIVYIHTYIHTYIQHIWIIANVRNGVFGVCICIEVPHVIGGQFCSFSQIMILFPGIGNNV